ETIEDTSPLKNQLIAGTFEFEKGENEFPGIVLGKGLADKTGVIPGDKIRIISPALSSTFSQPPVKSFIVTGIFETGLAEIDGGLCYIALPHAQKLYRMKDNINGVYVKLSTLDHTDATKTRLNENLEFPLNCISWKDLHSNLFAWFEIEKMMMGTILSLIIIIAAFNILSSLIMIVMEKKQEVGILMAMGANKYQVMRIFIYQGMIIGVIGTILGLALGIGVSWIQYKYQIVSLPGDIYFITAMPVQMRMNDFITIGVVSLALTFLSTIYPSMQASKMLPAEIMRNE
ncbi:MAG: FtsX-like permease family protein, partial [Candidatus Delongbacteria bacterium]|nr:FtsX-like permease family protein [Candidatus Delongbacteria bacterium]